MLDISWKFARGKPGIWGRRPRRRRRNQQRLKDGTRAAACRAIMAARIYHSSMVSTLHAAAVGCNVSIPYVRAALVVLQTEDAALLQAILDGKVQLLAAAAAMKGTAALISAYRDADPIDKHAFGCAVQVGTVWDEVISPLLGERGASLQHYPAYAA